MAPGSAVPDSPSQSHPLVLEVFSNSERAWHVGIVLGAKDGMFTVRFIGAGGEKRQKAAFQTDPMFAQFGTYIGDRLPPGVVKVPSTTRPGQFSFFDQAAQRKFATLELVWHAYLEKHLVEEDSPSSGPSPTAPTGSQVYGAPLHSSPGDKAPPLSPPPVSNSPVFARSAPEGPMVTPKIGSSGPEQIPTTVDAEGYRPEGPMLNVGTPPGSPRSRGWGHGSWPTKPTPGTTAPPPSRAFGHMPANTPSVPFGGDTAIRGPNISLHEWVSQYVHQPVLATAGITYLSQISIVFSLFAELLAPLAAANASNRDRIIHAIESGAFMRATLDVFDQWDTSGSRHLTWDNGVIPGYVTAVFTQYGLCAPNESQIQRMFQAFDIKKQLALGAQECVLLVDAIARAILRVNPTAGFEEERTARPVMTMQDQPKLEQPQVSPMDVKHVESACELHGLSLMEALGSATFAGHPLAALVRRRNVVAEAGPARPFVYSNKADKGVQMGPTEVHGVGLVEGATSIARLLIQRVPTSVLSGSPQGMEVRRRLQAKVAEMKASAVARQQQIST